MPLYEFRCPHCGPFDLRRDMQAATATAVCPSCAEPARRIYSVAEFRPGSGGVRGAGRADRARIDRALSGEPLVTGPPAGRRLSRPGGHHH